MSESNDLETKPRFPSVHPGRKTNDACTSGTNRHCSGQICCVQGAPAAEAAEADEVAAAEAAADEATGTGMTTGVIVLALGSMTFFFCERTRDATFRTLHRARHERASGEDGSQASSISHLP